MVVTVVVGTFKKKTGLQDLQTTKAQTSTFAFHWLENIISEIYKLE